MDLISIEDLAAVCGTEEAERVAKIVAERAQALNKECNLPEIKLNIEARTLRAESHAVAQMTGKIQERPDWEIKDQGNGDVLIENLSVLEEFEKTPTFGIYRRVTVVYRHTFLTKIMDLISIEDLAAVCGTEEVVAKIAQGLWQKSPPVSPTPPGALEAIDGDTYTPCLMIPIPTTDKDLAPIPIVF